MTATLHNIGTARALGHAYGSRGWRYASPYEASTSEHREYNNGFWNGNDERLNGGAPVVLPEVPIRTKK